MMKIGVRHNLIYPVMLIVFIGLRKIVEILLDLYFKDIGKYLLPFLIFISKFIAGFIAKNASKHIIKSNSRKTLVGVKLIQSKKQVPKADKNLKIIVLIFFASYFDIIGTMIRKYFSTVISNKQFLEERLKSFQIIASALLCYFTIRIKIYKHNLFCLIIIFVCLVIIIVIEMSDLRMDIFIRLTSVGIIIFSGLGRAFLDTIEKYLFEFNSMDPFEVMMFEGLINTILIICLFFFVNSSIEEEIRIFKNSEHLPYLIILIILYFIFSALKNIYRVATIKLYSPMTRALAESILDPLIIIYSSIIDSHKKIWFFWFYHGINIFLSIIMALCSCIYNDFLVLYFCGLEHDTYLEVSRRSLTIDKNPALPEDNSSSSDEEEDTELKNIINSNN